MKMELRYCRACETDVDAVNGECTKCGQPTERVSEMSKVKLEVVGKHGSDVVFLFPWKGQNITVTWEAPAGCIGPSFVFQEDLFDDDEAEEIHDFLRNHVDVFTTVTMETTK